MKNLETFEKQYLEKIKQTKKIPDFTSGDTIIVYVKVKEKKRERDQAFEGICISKKSAGINSSFTVRKISYGEGVERVFPLYSPNVSKIEVKSKGSVRRAKLYYLRKLTGRKAKITEDRNNLKGIIKKKEKKLKNTEKNIEKSQKKSSDINETKDNNKNKED
ncbi:MAG: 50S ribosomal protein L19 [Pelagibacteraceae bacterium]|nr:50S ribosomal protein L19 [Pelagibacteraceae bacterium]